MTLRVRPAEIVRQSESPLLSVHLSWQRVSLGDIAEVRNGFAFESKFFNKREGVPLLRIRDVGKDSTETRYWGQHDRAYIVRPGEIVVGMDGDFRVARWRGPEALLNQRVCKVVLRDQSLYDEDFLLYVLPGYLNAIHDFTSSVTVKHLSSETVKEIPLPLPPLAEQRRIVAAIEERLSRIDAGVEALRRARRNLERMRVAVLQAAVRGRLVSPETDDEPAEIVLKRTLSARREALARTGRAYFEPAAPNLDGAPDLPASWTWASLDALAEIVGGVTKDAKRELAPSFVEVPYLRVANVQRGYLDLTEIVTIRVPRDRVGQLRLLPGDILFTEGGDRDKLGRGWIWEGQIDPCIHQNHIFRARLYSAQFDPRFVSWHGNTFGQAWFVTAGKQTTNLASVSLSKLKRLPVPVPPPGEQRRIVSEVERQTSLIENLSQMVEMSLHRAGVLRLSVLQAAFAGRLVAGDPSDEPASLLLERIRGDRVADDFKRHHPLKRCRR